MDPVNRYDNFTLMLKDLRTQKLAQNDQMTLGALIVKLRGVPKNTDYRDKREIVFDFEGMHPIQFSSWRGSYWELALNFRPKGDPLTLKTFLTLCEETVGKTFCGYKGGHFFMDRDTPIWVANYGDCSETALVGVTYNAQQVVLLTGQREY